MGVLFSWPANNNSFSVSQEVQWRRDDLGVWNSTNVTPPNPQTVSRSQVEIDGFIVGYEYSIRVVMNCSAGGPNYSNIVRMDLRLPCIGIMDNATSTSTDTTITVKIPVTPPLAANTSKIKMRLYKQSDASFVEQVDVAVSNLAIQQTFVFGSSTPLIAGTAYYVTYQVCKTFGGVEFCSAQNGCGGNTTGYQISTVGAGLSVTYGRSDTDPYVDNSTIPSFGNTAVQSITHNSPITLSLASVFVGKFFVLKIPAGESAKTAWENGFGSNPIPDSVFRAPFTISGFTYIVSRDPAGLAFTPTNPIIFS